MPEVKLPPPQPQTKTTKNQLSDLELFARAYFGISLTRHQLRIIDDIANGREIRISRRMGQRTANKIIRAYIAEGANPMGRARLPQHHLPPRPKLKGLTQVGKVLALIRQPGGAYNFELSRVALKYTSVISDLRKDGHNIIAERQYLKNGRASNTYKYYIIG